MAFIAYIAAAGFFGFVEGEAGWHYNTWQYWAALIPFCVLLLIVKEKEA